MTTLVPPPDLKVQASTSDHFAWIRTLLSLQRTLMAATRTSVSLIGFGFTVSEFFTKIRSSLPSDIRNTRPDIPRNLGLLLIAVGVISLAIFLIQYRTAFRYLKSSQFEGIVAKGQKPLHQPSYYYACGVLLIGVAAFIAVLLRF